MKTETAQHTANLTSIVAALISSEEQQGIVTDPYNSAEREGLLERAAQIYDEILETARYHEFKPSLRFDDNGRQLELIQ
jgi:hypothetical protein